MKKIGQFIYPWGNGHYTRMMRLDEVLPKYSMRSLILIILAREKFTKNCLKSFQINERMYMKF